MHGFFANKNRFEDLMLKTCAIERIEPYLDQKKNLDEKYYFFAEKS